MEQMSKDEYIRRLKSNLSTMNKEDMEDAIRYVEEYFDEAGVENEAKVIEELGAPHRYAATLRADSTIKNTNEKLDNIHREQKRSSSNLKTLWIIILGIFALPIAFPVLIAMVAVVFALFATAAALIIAGIAAMFALIIVSIPSFFSSIPLLTTNFNTGILGLGFSFLSLGFGLLFITMLISVIRSFIPWSIKKMSNLFHRLKGGKKYETEQ